MREVKKQKVAEIKTTAGPKKAKKKKKCIALPRR